MLHASGGSASCLVQTLWSLAPVRQLACLQGEVAKAAQRAEVHMKVPVFQRLRPIDANTAMVPPVLDSSIDAEQLGLLSDGEYSRVPTQELELELQLEPHEPPLSRHGSQRF